MTAGVSPKAKARAGRSWDRVRSAAERLERMQPGAGEALILGAAAALDAYLLSAFPRVPQDRKAS